MGLVGPGAIQQNQVRPDATLTGASEYEYVRILNPLADDFQMQVAQSRPVDMPFNIATDPRTAATSKTESDVRTTYGLALKNPDHQSNKHILNQAIIPAGQTINLRGDQAQVAVRQLVNEIMQQRNLKIFLSDPNKRKEIENEIIVAHGSIEDLMDNRLTDQQTIINQAIDKSNEVKHEEAAFPGLNGSEEEGTPTAGPSSEGEKAKPSSRKTAS